MRARLSLIVGAVLVLVGAMLAHRVQTAGGEVAVSDVRFTGASGAAMSGLLYVPASATAASPAPAVLAVHGYINSRETQSGFAIELARRGYVVLALDESGHGYSAPPAFANGFGGPDGLVYLRTLPMVDSGRIGLEGHSMGGWAVLSAAAAHPDGYSAMVLEGSSTGSFGAPEGTPTFPRNLAVVFSQYDEFAELMWGVPLASHVAESPKLAALFGTTAPVEVGRVYGSADSGSARVLYTPAVTHPGDHHSVEAIGAALDWFGATLGAPKPRPAADQVWVWKELGTLAVLVGLVALLIGIGRLLYDRVSPAPQPPFEGTENRWAAVALFALPAVTYLPLFKLAEQVLPPSALFPQQITNGVIIWVIGNALITGVALAILRRRDEWRFDPLALLLGFVIALFAVGAIYVVAYAVSHFAAVDGRVWVVALKPLAPWHWPAVAMYLEAMLVFFPLLGAAVQPTLSVNDSISWSALKTALLLSGGFIVFLLIQYVPLLLGGSMPFGEPLLTIIAFQFVALLAIVGVITAVFLRRTGTVWLGAFINALFVTWLVVAGQATHV